MHSYQNLSLGDLLIIIRLVEIERNELTVDYQSDDEQKATDAAECLIHLDDLARRLKKNV